MFPRSGTVSIAAAGVGGDKELTRIRVDALAHRSPPSSDRCDGELSRVMRFADADPGLIARHVVDAVRDRLPDGILREVVHERGLRCPLWLPLATTVLEI